MKNNDVIDAKCSVCNTISKIKCESYKRTLKRSGKYRCLSCATSQALKKSPRNTDKLIGWSKSDAGRAAASRVLKQRWEDNYDELLGYINANWKNQETINKQKEIHEFSNRPDLRVKFRKIWASKEYREAVSDGVRRLWENPKYREKMAASRIRYRGIVSNIQKILYSLLDDLGIKYYREYNGHSDPQCKIGPWTFDCVVPRSNKPDLLIECQGDYWHSLSENMQRDRQKASYISNNLSGRYELKYIWEHEFYAKDRIRMLLAYWVGLKRHDIIDFNFKDVAIRKCVAKDYKLLLSKYHYLANAGRGGIAYGAYVGDRLASICVFSPLPRQNIAKSLGCLDKEVRDLSRLCIHPNYQKKNFASWFVSRCIKLLPPQYAIVIAYCDTTFGHNGVVYEASNFKLDKEIRPDYWYTKPDGWIMHKKTLYDRAVKMGIKEREFAELHGYIKVKGDKKYRYVFKR